MEEERFEEKKGQRQKEELYMRACEPIYCWEGAFSLHYPQLTESVIRQDSTLLWRLQYFKPDGSSLKKHVLYHRQFS